MHGLLVALLRHHDPLYGTTWSMLDHMLEILPHTAEQIVRAAVDGNPNLFLRLYGEMREWAREVEHRGHRRRHARSRSTHAPARQGDGGREARRLAALDALKARVKSGRAEEGDLLRYIQLSMGDNPDEPGFEGGR